MHFTSSPFERMMKEKPRRQSPAENRPPSGSACCGLSLIHISEPTRQAEISYAVFCLKKKTKVTKKLEHIIKSNNTINKKH